MKKLLITSLVVIVLLTGCSQVVTPTQPPVEPTLPVEESPAVQTPIIEEPTEEPTPTLEPTVTPTEEPTPEPLPDRCPSEGFEIPDPEDLIIDLGEYGEITFYDVHEGKSNFLVLGKNGNFVKRGEKTLDSLYLEGGSLSFKLPSPAVMFLEEGVKIHTDVEYWTLGDSEGMAYIIPRGVQIELTLEQGVLEEDILFIFFLSGKPVELVDIVLSHTTSLTCKEMWYELTIENENVGEEEVKVSTKHLLVLQDYEGVIGLNSENRKELEVQNSLAFENDTVFVRLAQGGKVKFAILSLFGRNQ